MPKPIIKGTLQPIRQSVQIRYDPTTGTTTTEEFEGAGENCGGLASQFAQAGASFDLSGNQLRTRLVATSTRNIFTGEEAVSERWELFSNQQQLDIKESGAWAALSAETKAAVLKDVNAHLDKGTPITGVRPWGEVGGLSTADHFFQLMIRGTTHYLVPQWVVRVTFNVSNTNQFFVPDNGGVADVYSTAQLGPPAGRLRSTIQSIVPPAGSSYLRYGWLKVTHSEVWSARNIVDVSGEYWLGQWPNILYP